MRRERRESTKFERQNQQSEVSFNTFQSATATSPLLKFVAYNHLSWIADKRPHFRLPINLLTSSNDRHNAFHHSHLPRRTPCPQNQKSALHPAIHKCLRTPDCPCWPQVPNHWCAHRRCSGCSSYSEVMARNILDQPRWTEDRSFLV